MRVHVDQIAVDSPESIRHAEPMLRARVLRCIQNLAFLADGGYTRERVTLTPAGMVTVERPVMIPATNTRLDDDARIVVEIVRDERGNPVMVPREDDNGQPVYLSELLYPELPPGQLVVVSQQHEVAAPDRQANEYLINRIMGKPHKADSPRSEESIGTLPAILEAALERAYGDRDAEGNEAALLAIEQGETPA